MPLSSSELWLWRLQLHPAWLVILLVGGGGAGCAPTGPARQAVRGDVTLDGKPVSGVVVVFRPAGAEQIGAAVETLDGGFALDSTQGPSAGKHYVTVAIVEPELEEFEVRRRAGKRPFSTLKIHPRYTKPGALEVEVECAEENIFKFELKSR